MTQARLPRYPMFKPVSVVRAFSLGAMLAAAPFLRGAESAELQALREQVRALEQQVKLLAQKIEAKQEAEMHAAPSAPPKMAITDHGYTFASADGANAIRFRGLLQGDNRQFFNDAGGLANNAFVMRRVRLITEGTFAKYFNYQFVPEFGGSSVTIHEANLSLAFNKAMQFRFGRFKEPIGLERLQSDSWTFLNERSIVTNLVPDRDIGVLMFGEVGEGRINYALGVFNGLADGASSNNTDFDDEKDVVARILATPFKGAAGSPLHGLSLGIGGSMGRQKSTAGRTSGY